MNADPTVGGFAFTRRPRRAKIVTLENGAAYGAIFVWLACSGML